MGSGSLVSRGMGGFFSSIANIFGYYWKRYFWDKGERFFELEVPLFGDTLHPIKVSSNIYGDFGGSTIVMTTNLNGDFVSHKGKLLESMLFGDVSHVLNESIKLTGKKDFKRLILELLFDDD